jgi:hypothetical protein
MKNQSTFALSFEKKTIATFESSNNKNGVFKHMGETSGKYCEGIF